MSINYVSDNNGDTIAVQIPINEWYQLTEKYPDIEVDQAEFDIPLLQKEEILRRKKYYDQNPDELLTWEEARKRLKIK